MMLFGMLAIGQSEDGESDLSSMTREHDVVELRLVVRFVLIESSPMRRVNKLSFSETNMVEISWRPVSHT